MQSVKISATIITYNEEGKIADAIKSVAWADEVLVVDSESIDRTREIAESLGATVIVRPWPGFSRQKQFAVDSATYDWILSLDADERVTPELEQEIRGLTTREDGRDGYEIPRRSIYMGRKIRFGGWYPDRQLRLFDRRKGRWKDRVIHESFEIEAASDVGQLKSELLHFSVDGPEHHARMVAERYAPLSARQMLKEGKRSSGMKAVVAGIGAFVRTYILKLGFLDGLPGFLIAFFAAENSLLKHLILLDLLRKQASGESVETTTTYSTGETSNLS